MDRMTQSITPFLMFDRTSAKDALDFYASIFNGARISSIEYFEDTGGVKRALLELPGQTLILMDSPARHEFTFTPSISQFVVCDNEAEIDALAAALSDGGKFYMPLDTYDFSRRFCWVEDRFGVSWQLNLP